MKVFAFFDTKEYDKIWFDKYKEEYGVWFEYIQDKLNKNTAYMTKGVDGVVVFVHDEIDSETIDILCKNDVKLIALRCAGFNNVDLKAAKNKIKVVRVPGYSPYSVAEYTVALLFAVNRKIHRAYLRTRDFNFDIDGLMGFDLRGKIVGIIGTGRIGCVMAELCIGLGMKVLAYDPYPKENMPFAYVPLEELFKRSDVISLHCPLTDETHHIIDKNGIAKMKDGVIILNTSRGELIDTDELTHALKTLKIGGAGLDVYEEEGELFYENHSNTVVQDDIIARLLSMPNVIVTSHQAFLTCDALENIAKTTFENIDNFFKGNITNEIEYKQ